MPYQGYYHKQDKPVPEKEVAKTESQNAPEDTAGKTENFFTCHVKLLTFLACLVVFLTFFGPWSVHRIIEWRRQKVANENPFPEERVEYLIEKGDRLTWADFGDYSYSVIAEDLCYTRQYVTADGTYYIMVTSEKEGGTLTSVILIRTSDYQNTELLSDGSAGFTE